MTRLATGIIPFRPKTFRGKWVPPKALCLSAHHPPPGSADGPSWSAGFGRPSFGEMSISRVASVVERSVRSAAVREGAGSIPTSDIL